MSMAVKYSMKRRNKMAQGGQVGESQSECNESCNSPCDMHSMPDDDMVNRVMKKRMMSKGGRVANSDDIEAGFIPNEFDDLHLRDDLEFSYTGENSGDHLGSDEEDERRKDLVSRAMMRRHKQRNPRPA